MQAQITTVSTSLVFSLTRWRDQAKKNERDRQLPHLAIAEIAME